MDIELLKKLEDLKKDENDLLVQLQKKVDNDLNSFVDVVISEFKNFFHEKEFTLDINKQSLKAHYGTLYATLSEQTRVSFGSSYEFGLQIHMPYDATYLIVINPKNKKQDIPFLTHNAKASLEDQLEQKQEDIKALNKCLENYQDKEWELDLQFRSGTAGQPYLSGKYLSMADLLINLFR